ncbi:hypothetical protein FRB94_009805 [Tulasnella sp. JGI-2019a]|nr:hypothetical protein FRB94_009805 [Tulasnella sp. JGI-2019a]
MLSEVRATLQSQPAISTFQNSQLHKLVIDLVFTSPSAHHLYLKCDTDKSDNYNHKSNHFPIIHQILLDIPDPPPTPHHLWDKVDWAAITNDLQHDLQCWTGPHPNHTAIDDSASCLTQII